MGEVYQARDTTLDRDVALKVHARGVHRRPRSAGAGVSNRGGAVERRSGCSPRNNRLARVFQRPRLVDASGQWRRRGRGVARRGPRPRPSPRRPHVRLLEAVRGCEGAAWRMNGDGERRDLTRRLTHWRSLLRTACGPGAADPARMLIETVWIQVEATTRTTKEGTWKQGRPNHVGRGRGGRTAERIERIDQRTEINGDTRGTRRSPP